MTSVRQVKWTKRGRKRFRVIYKVRREFCDILSIRHTAFLIKSMRSL